MWAGERWRPALTGPFWPFLGVCVCETLEANKYCDKRITTSFFSLLHPTAVQIFQESPQLRKEVQLHQEEPERSGDEERLAVQAGSRARRYSGSPSVT